MEAPPREERARKGEEGRRLERTTMASGEIEREREEDEDGEGGGGRGGGEALAIPPLIRKFSEKQVVCDDVTKCADEWEGERGRQRSLPDSRQLPVLRVCEPLWNRRARLRLSNGPRKGTLSLHCWLCERP